MKFPASSCASMTFGKIIEPDKNKYTYRQEKLASSFRELVQKVNPDDPKGRTYLTYMEEAFHNDYLVRSVDDGKRIDLYTYDSRHDEYDFVGRYKKGVKVKENDLQRQVFFIKEKITEFKNNVLAYALLGLVVLGLAVVETTKKPVVLTKQKFKTEQVCDSIKTLQKTSLNVVKNIAK